MPNTGPGPANFTTNSDTRHRDDARREPQRVPFQSGKPHLESPLGGYPTPQQNPHADRQSSHGIVYSYIPPEYKNRAPANATQPEPFSQDKIKIPYSNFTRAGPHNAKPATGKPAKAKESESKKQMDKMRAQFEKQQAEARGRTQQQPTGTPAEQGNRKRSGSLTRFVNWIERTLSGSQSGRPSSSGSGARPGTAQSNASSTFTQKPATQAPKKSQEIRPPVATGIRASFVDSEPVQQPKAYAPNQPHQAQNPAVNYNDPRATTGTTWSNFLDRTAAPKPPTNPANPPPIPARPTNHVPTPATPSRKPVPQPTPTPSQTTSHHAKNPSASKIIHKVAHPLSRRASDVSDLSFFCSGVEDEALEVTSTNRANVIARQKEERLAFEEQNRAEEAQRVRRNPVFEARRQQMMEENEEAEKRLERRLRESTYARGQTVEGAKTCVVCEVESPMSGADVCRVCAEKYPGIGGVRESVVGVDLGSLTGPSTSGASMPPTSTSNTRPPMPTSTPTARPTSTASTIYDVDLSNYAGPFACPPSSIYPDARARPFSGYTIGNPYSEKREKVGAPPMPAVPEMYRVPKGPTEGYQAMKGGRETKDTAFYEEIDEVHEMYRSGGPKTPKEAPKWRSARASGIY